MADEDLPRAVALEDDGGNQRIWGGTQAKGEALAAMLRARGLSPRLTGDHEIEGGTAIVEALIFVPPDEAEDAQALIADVESGAAEKH